MNPKVLIVDDEVAILNGIKLNLGRTFDITAAANGEEAIKSADEEGPFEVVVSDMRMPGMSGAEVLARIKSEHPEIMTILLTGHADLRVRGLAGPSVRADFPHPQQALSARQAQGCNLRRHPKRRGRMTRRIPTRQK